MASIAIVEAYPYATIRGGDAVYLDRLRHYLLSCGNDVTSLVTDTSRGRGNPFVRLHGRLPAGHRWQVRGAIRLAPGLYLSIGARFLGNVARRLARRKVADGDPTIAEGNWLLRQVVRTSPDVVILAFGACAFARSLRGTGSRIAALRGFLAEVELRLDGDGRPADDLVTARYDELASADFVAFNNKVDAASYNDATGRPASVVGMSFPRKASVRPASQPILLFVGAATSCNSESLQWFLDRCWNDVLDAVPEAQFRIVGSVAAVLPSPLPRNVVAAGVVDDLDAEYGAAQVVVAPLVSGSSGVKTKVVEGLSHGRALVTTSLGIEPDDRQRIESGLRVADDPASFTHDVVRLLTDAPMRAELEAGAIRLFDTLYSEESAYSSLKRFIDSVGGRSFARVPDRAAGAPKLIRDADMSTAGAG
jgi:glycosyltransferase involved in cell wall biosynthesis